MKERAQTDHAPILVFAYKRAEHLRRCMASLVANPEASQSDLIVYCDGARSPEDADAVVEVRAVVNSAAGFRSITRIHREANAGLAKSIIEGVTAQLEKYESVIVVEDDLIVSSGFLKYMNSALRAYASDQSVASIHAYCYPVRETLPETFFLRGADCWGWATWRRAWDTFCADGSMLLNRLQEMKLIGAFDFDGAYPFSRMLRDQVAGRNDSWAVRWHASCFLQGMLTLYPGKSLVHNIGNDSSGSHSKRTEMFDVLPSEGHVDIARVPIVESVVARRAFARFLSRSSLRNRVRYAASSAHRFLRSITRVAQ